jgi:hypothetical protein
VWDDTDIVGLTKQGAGTLTMVWQATGHTTLACEAGSPLNGNTAQIEAQVELHVLPNGSVQGVGRTRVAVAGRSFSTQGRYTGTTTINQGTLTVHGDYNGDGAVDGADFVALMHFGDSGQVNLATRQFTMHTLDNVLINWGDGAAH